ncbi:MAG: hypothetical protein IT473_15095, partial [Lysobacter sp.]|nr:hypothetical protein [Lysobacter sp.]
PVMALVGCADAPPPKNAVPAAGLALHAISMQPCAGCRKAQHNGLDAYLKPMPVASSADIERIETTVDYLGLPAIQIRFTSAASGRLLRATAEHISQPLAWKIDDTILAVATVNEPFGSDMILTGIDAAETDRLYKRMTGSPSRLGEQRRRPE